MAKPPAPDLFFPVLSAVDIAALFDLAPGPDGTGALAQTASASASPFTLDSATHSTLASLASSFSLGASVGPLAGIAGRSGGLQTEAPVQNGTDSSAAAIVTPASIVTVALGTTAAQLQQLVNTVPEGTNLQLQAGQYQFDSTITIARDNISIIGVGSDQTFINVAPGLGQEAFSIGDGQISGAFILATDVAEGGTVITLTGPHIFVAGDYVYLERALLHKHLEGFIS